MEILTILVYSLNLGLIIDKYNRNVKISTTVIVR
jgi:hypothetical protein